ncbi:hypothetical protein [Sphingomonas oryzagri]|uniref:Uncharacterized protein n=1 Tax=Sphingomonas oryzagri TaxID=3042314 RepID=A0ABT6N601_9SPHN|nr:hypothetical protein [Sphingomonas oryzagri]MDH7640549.1 hypothetical protein [Sphingomonas oryzagri]
MSIPAIIQADRDWWADYLSEVYGAGHPDIVAIRAGERDNAKALRMIAQHRVAYAPPSLDGRPSDDSLLPHLPESISAAKRCGMQRSHWLDGWFVPWSPRNDNENAEGPWSDWVALALRILETDAKARAALAQEGAKA